MNVMRERFNVDINYSRNNKAHLEIYFVQYYNIVIVKSKID